MILSVVIPVYNEINFIEECIDQVLNAKRLNLDLEIIISDNNSTDGTKEFLKSIRNPLIKVLFRDKNEGKGSNVINALNNVKGDIVIIQDADLEYSPKEYENILEPILNNSADVVYGTRFSRSKPFHVYSFVHLAVNKIITTIVNIFFNKSFSDVLTGYKVFKFDALKNLNLKSKSFDIDTELTIKLIKKKLRIYEVPIAIYSRNYSQGKKIYWYHFFTLIFSIIKWRVID